MKSWNKNTEGYITDEKAFLFDLDKNEKYDIVNPSYAIWSGSEYGSIFGFNHDIRLKDDYMNNKESSYHYHKNSLYYKYPDNIDHNKVYFNCKELEVYQILFN